MYRIEAYDTDDPPADATVAQLAEFRENETVEYADGKYGVVVATHDGEFEWKGETRNPDGTMYIVARETGGTKPFTADELSAADPETAFQRDKASMDDPAEKLDSAELSAVYDRLDNPHSAAELASLPGVDDPEVGLESWPDSWVKADRPARVIALDVWTSWGASFSGCVSEMSSQVSTPNKFCAAFKDEIWGSEEAWR